MSKVRSLTSESTVSWERRVQAVDDEVTLAHTLGLEQGMTETLTLLKFKLALYGFHEAEKIRYVNFSLEPFATVIVCFFMY